MPSGPTRREFISLTTASALLYGFHVPYVPLSSAVSTLERAGFEPNAFIRIDAQDVVTLIIPQVEMGQGTYTSLAMILADELDAYWNLVRVEHAPADQEAYGNPMLSIQMTGNSTSVRAFWKPLRHAGATTRARLLEAAARAWNVPASECRTQDSKVIHDRTGRKLDYAALIGAAASVPPLENVPLKDHSDFRLIGRPLKRLDTLEKANGTAKCGVDVLLPRMKFATLAQSPVLAGTVTRVDDARARAIPGVRRIVVLNDLVAVVGDNMWAAKRGLEALDISWNDGPNADVSSELIWSRLRSASKRDGAVAKEVGHVDAVFGEDRSASDVVTAESVQSAVAQAANVPESRVIVHNHLLGGGFGRRLEADMAYHAARIAKHVQGPVKVVWTREEDIRHDIYRPPYHDILSARLQGDRIVGWKHKVSGSAILARFLPAGFQNGVDLDGVESAHDIPYDIPNCRVEFNREEPPGVITGLWRGVGANNAVFAIESFMDELAHRVGADPIAFRRAHLHKSPRLQAALDIVRRRSGWDTSLPPRCGRGVAAQASFGSYIATVVECGVDEAGEIELRRVTAAVDTGLAINPDTIVAQLEGGLIFGLTAALYGEITLAQGRVQQSNFHDYPMLRIGQVPSIEVYLIKSDESPGGIGEAGTTAAIPALRNAIYDATGVGLRRMPIDRRALAAIQK